MADNLSGVQPSEGNQPSWSPGNGGLGQEDKHLTNQGPEQQSGAQSGAGEYKDKILDVVSQAKDYLGDKASTVGEKIKDFATNDLSGYADKAKDFARQNPGQAILISAAAGLILGLIVRGRR